jgi:hypothetical protein
VSGNVTASSPVNVNVTAIAGAGPWKIMTAANIAPQFTAAPSSMRLDKLNGNTELWVYPTVGTLIVIR